MLALGLSLWPYAEVGSLYAHFLESFYHKWMLKFIKSFFCISWDDHIAFILQFLNVVYHTDWFVDTEKVFASFREILLDHGVWFFMQF